jgi:hypothetical protein
MPPLGWKVEVVRPFRPRGDLGQLAARKISLRASSVVDMSEFYVFCSKQKRKSENETKKCVRTNKITKRYLLART